MRMYLALLPLAGFATAAAAQPAPTSGPIIVPPELTDPAMVDRVSGMMESLSRAMLDLKVGELQAAVEGRAATPAEKQLTVRDLGRREDPNFERNLERNIADSRAGMHAGMRAMAKALPAMSRAMREAADELERATANLPSPNYPNR